MAGNNNDDPVWILLILLTVIGGICWGIWVFFEPQFLTGLKYLRMAELGIMSIYDDRAGYCFTWLRYAPVGELMPTDSVRLASHNCFGAGDIQSMPIQEAIKYYNITSESIGLIGQYVGSHLKWIVFIVCAGFAYVAAFVSKRNFFKTRHTLETFIKSQVSIWPVISPIVNFNPTKASARILGHKVPDKTPLFAEAFAPEEWIAYHRIPVVNNVPEREAVRRAFMRQLGPRWNGYQDLPIHYLALFAAFALKGVQKRDESDDFLGKISLCWSADKGFKVSPELKSEIMKILKDPAVGGVALEIAGKHAYRTTALLGVLKWARYMGGVLAAAQCLWVRGVDRELWYAINNLGRRSFHTEGAGAIAHYMAEDAAGKALPTPRLDTAIVTLNIYMGGDTLVQVPPREEPAQAKR